MDTQYMEARFRLEHAMLDELLNGRGTLLERRERVIAQQAGNVPTSPGPLPGMNLPGAVLNVALSPDVYRWAAHGYRYANVSEEIPFTDEIIEESKAFVSNLLGVDLTEVRVVCVPSDEWGDEPAEGYLYEAGADAPVVFVPEAFYSPQELLVHELAHAAHTLARRRDGDPAKAFSSPASAEFIAHFTQYRYLLAYGTEADFAAAMGQLTTAMYALAIFADAQEQGGLRASVEGFLASAHARPFLEALGEETPRAQFAHFMANRENLWSEVHRALGIMLAVIFRHDDEGVEEFMAIDSLDRSIADKVAEAFGMDLGDQLPLFEGHLQIMRDELR